MRPGGSQAEIEGEIMKAKPLKKTNPFWIKERHNPQLRVYYVGMGQLSVAAAKRHTKALYGHNYMLRFDTEADYQEKLNSLRKEGQRVE
jgi:hypothetical protein